MYVFFQTPQADPAPRSAPSSGILAGVRSLRIVVFALCFGCASGGSPSETLLYAVRDFNNELRWGRYDQLSPYLKPEVRERFLEQLQGAGDDIEVVDQELSNIAQRAPGEATARVEWSWSSKRRGLLEKTTLRQVWGQVPGGRWQLLRQERLAGPPLRPFEDPAPRQPPSKAAPAQVGGAR